ncbi:MAG TPA: universal stress protein, partial [Vicinamibacterales bacterium]|nr:universal stress protein [Vicinamibacterales bacterium]
MPSRNRSKTGYQSILCAVDFSPQSSAALQMAALIARRCAGHLTAIYVEDPLLSTGAAAAGYDTSLIRESTLRQLDRLMRRIARSTALAEDCWTVETLPGRPAQTLAKVAKDLKADLVVMGTNGRRGPAKLVFGSVADGVLRRTSVPVLAVSRSKPGRKELRIENRPILGAIDLGPNEAADARRQARAAAGFG